MIERYQQPSQFAEGGSEIAARDGRDQMNELLESFKLKGSNRMDEQPEVRDKGAKVKLIDKLNEKNANE